MTAPKKKTTRENRSEASKNDEGKNRHKCPKAVKDCLKCRMSDCPEER